MKERTYRVLIVEDQRELARMIRLAVESLGERFSAVDVPSAEEALLEAIHRPVDVLIADLRLPGMGGDELIRRLQRQQPNLKVFVLTALSRDEAQAATQDLQIHALFRKPFEMADLLDALERHLELVESAFDQPFIVSVGEQQGQMRRRLSDLLADLRREVGFHSLMLIGESGYTLARAGEWPEGVDESRLITALLTLLSAGNRVVRSMPEVVPQDLFLLPGRQQALLMTNVSDRFALLAWSDGHQWKDRLPQMTQALWETARQLEQVLRDWGFITETREAGPILPLETKPSPPEEGEEEVEAAQDLLALLNPEQASLAPEDAEAFWESLAAEDPGGVDTAVDALSFEQAKKLGLVPPAVGDDQE